MTALGHAVALRYTPERRGFDSFFHLYNPFGHTTALGSTQSLNSNEYQEYFLS
jgi:hypothetical protein